jgi:general secretion pathway protein F
MVFEVKALSAAGQVVVLRIDASAEAEARRQAELRGMSVFMARPVRQGGGFSLRPRRAGMQVLPFVQELLTLLRAGLTLVSALEAIAEKESNPAARASVEALLLRLRRGGRLSEALAEPGNEFPQILVAGIRASERTGNLDEALQRYCDYAGRMDDVRKKIVAAMIYPTLLLVVGLLVSAFLIGYVVPKFASVYRESGGEMPWASALLLDIGRLIGAHTFSVLAGTGAVVVALLLAWSRPATRVWLGARVRQLPGFGPRIRVYEMARLYRTLAMLLRGGTPIVPALGLASSMLSVVMRAQLARSAKQISQGAPLSRAFESNGLTTAVGNRMLGVGERGGGMADMLERIADYHDEETARWVDWVSRLFEPIMMALLGLVIGGIVILLYMPIFDLAGSVQ